MASFVEGFDAFGGAEAAVCFSALQEGFDMFLIEMCSLRLSIRAERASNEWSLIPL